jgi:hypothetical protein
MAWPPSVHRMCSPARAKASARPRRRGQRVPAPRVRVQRGCRAGVRVPPCCRKEGARARGSRNGALAWGGGDCERDVLGKYG